MRKNIGAAVAIGFFACSRHDPAPQPTPAASASVAPPPATLAGTHRPLPEGARSSSALALVSAGEARVAVVADEDDRRLRFVSLPDGRALADVTLAGTPGHVVVDAEGLAWVTIRDADRVASYALRCEAKGCDVTAGRVIETAREPIALALSAKTLAVVSGWGRALETFATDTGERLHTIALAREPRSVLLAKGGTRAVVGHAAGSALSTVDLGAAAAYEERLDYRDNILFANAGAVRGDEPRFVGHGYALARPPRDEHERVLAPAELSYPGEPEGATAGYGGPDVAYFPSEPCVVSLDETHASVKVRTRGIVVAPDARRSNHERIPWPKDRPACLLPRAAAVHPDGSLLVACLGIDQVAAIDAAEKPLVESMRGRWTVPSGPVAIAVDAGKNEAWVWSMFDRKLSRLALDAAGPPTASLEIPRAKARDEIWPSGQKLFHAPIAFDGRACASCHPDGRTDGLRWSSPNGPMQPPMLAGRLEGTGPFGWLGDGATVEAHLKQTMRRLEARAVTDAEIRAVAAYATNMPTYLSRTSPSALEDRGRAIFESSDAGCSSCHHEAGRTGDGLRHDVGTGGAFDTPSLRFVGGTAPYMHDGRYATLRELLVRTNGKMGSTSRLREADVLALIAYLRSI